VVFRQEVVPTYVDSDRVALDLGPPRDVTLDAGASESVPLTLVNFSERIERFEIDVDGVNPSWWRLLLPDGTFAPDGQVPQVRLDTAEAPVPQPRATAHMQLILTPPHSADARAGIYPMVIRATGLENRRLRRTATGQLTVKPFHSMRLAPLDEPAITATRGR